MGICWLNVPYILRANTDNNMLRLQRETWYSSINQSCQHEGSRINGLNHLLTRPSKPVILYFVFWAYNNIVMGVSNMSFELSEVVTYVVVTLNFNA